MTRYFFYKCTVAPDKYDYYDHSFGVAGYRTQQARKGFILYGTINEVDEFINSRQARTAERRFR